MANECIEYKKHLDQTGNLTDPSWMRDGGYFPSSEDKTYVGFVPVEAERDWYVPDTVSMLTEQEFVNRLKALHAASPVFTTDYDADTQEAGEPLNAADAEAKARSFYNEMIA